MVIGADKDPNFQHVAHRLRRRRGDPHTSVSFVDLLVVSVGAMALIATLALFST